jgi:hypothetical protein
MKWILDEGWIGTGGFLEQKPAAISKNGRKLLKHDYGGREGVDVNANYRFRGKGEGYGVMRSPLSIILGKICLPKVPHFPGQD